jgi:ComF family protein
MSYPDSIRQVYRRILPSFLPASICVLCDAICNEEDTPPGHRYLCNQCLSDLPFIQTPCYLCGDVLSINETTNICGSCLHKQSYYQKSIIPLEYSFPATNLVKNLKYKENFLVSGVLSQILIDRIKQDGSTRPDTIIPVPLHPVRLIRRGFNQSALIASILSKELNIPIDRISCRRIKNTQQQTGFNKKQRIQNIRNCFSVCSNFPAENIAIVDDVVTTGSTVNELAKTLLIAGAKSVVIWACARATSY